MLPTFPRSCPHISWQEFVARQPSDHTLNGPDRICDDNGIRRVSADTPRHTTTSLLKALGVPMKGAQVPTVVSAPAPSDGGRAGDVATSRRSSKGSCKGRA